MSTAPVTSKHQDDLSGSGSTSTLAIAIYFALTGLFVHLLTNGRYGYFRDELYYLACGDHLDWGYVDHAPLIGLVAKSTRILFGDSLRALHFLPALSAAAKILLTGLIARELGGRRLAVSLACLCVLVSPVFLIIDNQLAMNTFEPLLWMGCAYLLILIIKRNKPHYWLWFGLLAGLGLENKHSMLFFGCAVVLGLLLAPERRFFADKWIWIAGAIALLLFLPNLIWEQQHHWPTIEDLNNVRMSHKNVELPPLAFIGQQVLMLSPASAPVWVAGLWFFLFDQAGKRYRALGWTYLSLLALMMALKGKDYYLAPAYPMLFAGGGVWWEKLIDGHRRVRWLKVALPAIIFLPAAIFMPLALPILPVETLLRYQDAIGFRPPRTEVGMSGPLPQYFGDMFGWTEMVDTVARIYFTLPPEERAKTAILAGNYGEAAAIDFFGPRYHLPKAISAHQSYFYWGPRDYTGEVMILLEWDRRSAERSCQSVEEAAVLDHPYTMGWEHYSIFICRGLKKPLSEVWPSWKHWN
jgi:hypothetical protein